LGWAPAYPLQFLGGLAVTQPKPQTPPTYYYANFMPVLFFNLILALFKLTPLPFNVNFKLKIYKEKFPHKFLKKPPSTKNFIP